ncbi:ribonuclease H family protein [Paenibacillus kobensis]|uniref:hypothetical protein n=1 Tax=Paenibacillus kobensis TaxID=59841 RepID=UPI000FDABD7D|nr:hypothetical protein [Paenibacillus kobensis]
MDPVQQTLMNRAFATPSLRQNILNRGMIYIYCDYSGHQDRKEGGVAYCFVHNRAIYVTAKKIDFEDPGDSVYGELQAILYSLEALEEAFRMHRPKGTIVFTDYSRIAKLFMASRLSNSRYEEMRNQITAAIEKLKNRFADIEITITYISKHKKNNALHQLAHNAARKVIGK